MPSQNLLWNFFVQYMVSTAGNCCEGSIYWAPEMWQCVVKKMNMCKRERQLLSTSRRIFSVAVLLLQPGGYEVTLTFLTRFSLNVTLCSRRGVRAAWSVARGPSAASLVPRHWPFSMAEAERGRGEITPLNLLCRLCARRVSMATHSLRNPPSSSRWGDDAAGCLRQVWRSPRCKPVHVAGFQATEQSK